MQCFEANHLKDVVLAQMAKHYQMVKEMMVE